MQSSQQLRSTSGCSCSTSSRCSTAAPRIAYFIVRADSEPRPTKSGIADGWLGSSCFLQRRPSYPKTALTAREVASLDTPVTSVQNGKPFRIYETTEFVAETLLPTIQGNFRVRAYRHTVDGGRTYTEPCCIMTGQPEGCENVPLRVHDACFTSEVLGSLKCDCAGQLQLALEYMQEHAPGMIIYLQQEGRGIGLANKIAAYALQEKGLDTVDANRALGLPDDCREYTSVRNMLADLGIKSVKLMTNNPRKIRVLEQLGVQVTERLPCIVKAQALNMAYLSTKQRRMAHLLTEAAADEQLSAQGELVGQWCYWNHDGEPLSPIMSPVGTNDAEGPAAGSASAAATQADDCRQQQERLAGKDTDDRG